MDVVGSLSGLSEAKRKWNRLRNMIKVIIQLAPEKTIRRRSVRPVKFTGFVVKKTSTPNMLVQNKETKTPMQQIISKMVEKKTHTDQEISLESNEALFNVIDIQDEQAIKNLLDQGVSYFKHNSEGETPIHRAVKNRLFLSLKVLIEYKVPVNLVDDQGRTPLHIAILVNWPEGIDMLLEHEANIRAKTKDGYTAIHLAADIGNVALLEELLTLPGQEQVHSFYILHI